MPKMLQKEEIADFPAYSCGVQVATIHFQALPVAVQTAANHFQIPPNALQSVSLVDKGGRIIFKHRQTPYKSEQTLYKLCRFISKHR